MMKGDFRWPWGALLFVVAALMGGPAAEAQVSDIPKTEVGVVFGLSDPHYTDEFSDAELPALTASATEAVSRVLRDKIRFLAFSANAETGYRLTVKLERAEGSRADGPAEFGFHLALSGPEVRDDARGYLLFRAKDQFLAPIGDADSLVREIELVLEATDHRDLVRRVLRHVAIAGEADLNAQPLGWIVKRDRTDFCVDRDSRLAVVNAFPSFGGTLHESFEARVLNIDRPDGGIVSLADTSIRPEMIEQLKAIDPTTVQVERIFIVDYRRFCPPSEVPASDVDFSGEERFQ